MSTPQIARFIALFLLVGALLVPARAHALGVTGVRFGTHPDNIRLVLDLSTPADFRVFALNDPYRMVIDLPDFNWQAGNASAAPATGVRALRYGKLQPGVARIVFDMAWPIAVKSAFTIPAKDGQPNRLVIDFQKVTDAAFRAEKDTIHGTLTTEAGTLRAPEYSTSPSTRTAGIGNIAPPPRPTPPESVVRKPLVVIDPGHGGVDPGAHGINGTNEKIITLAIAKELKAQLESTGRYRVALTRSDDRFIKLRDRVKIARQKEADLFISIHADSIGHSDVSGVSVYTLSEKASDAQTAKLAEQENKSDLIAGIDLSTEDKEVASILVDLAMRDTMNQSGFFANTFLKKLQSHKLNILDKPHRSAGFAVLKAPDIPSVLVETGFMSNKKEAALLSTPAYRKKIASSLREAVDAYFEKVRKNQRI